MRLVEIRLLDGPNVYRLLPVVKIEVAIGRGRAWSGERDPGGRGRRLGTAVPPGEWPIELTVLVPWLRRLRLDHGEGPGGVAVHRASDPGRWVVTCPWRGAERARTIAEAAIALVGHDASPARTTHLTGTQARLVARWTGRIAAAGTTPPAWISDAQRRVPVISISGTNGKTTVTRIVAHILLGAGRRVGMTTSDGVYVDGRLVESGDWTGPGGAARVLGQPNVDVAVLETARGGILLRGVGYESNEASVVTNVSPDHLDLQGIHTLAELAEVKATICRMTKPGGWVVLNADDRHVAAIARRVRGEVVFFSVAGPRAPRVARHLAAGGRGFVLDGDGLVEMRGGERTDLLPTRDVPIALGGLARHNVANALAAAASARALGASVDDVRVGLASFQPSPDASPGRLNLFRLGRRLVIVDFAHNEAGLEAVLDVAEGLAAGGSTRATPITAIIGTAGDRPDDALRGIGFIAGRRAQRVAIKETPRYLRGRSADEVVERLREGLASAGRRLEDVPVYPSEVDALRGELAHAAAAEGSDSEVAAVRGDLVDASGEAGRTDAARVVVLMCHAERDEVGALLDEQGARPLDVGSELDRLVPRLQEPLRPD